MNKKYEKKCGYCPVQEINNYEITIEYLLDRTLEGEEYVKNKFDCRYKTDSQIDCTRNTCPIYQASK